MTRSSSPYPSPENSDYSHAIKIGFSAEPIVDICGSSQLLLYSECLARMMVADNIVRGGDIIVDLETYGGIELLDAAILDLVLDALANDPKLLLGCNISPRTLSDATAWKAILRRLDQRQSLASRLTLEITETCPLNEILYARTRLAEVQRLGCRIAVDDFGAGYASAQHLQDANIEWDIVKIDRSCFAGENDGASLRSSLRSLVSQASRFAPVLVVEGLETYDRLHAAQDVGLRFGQGWLFESAMGGLWTTSRAGSRLTAAIKSNCATAKLLAGCGSLSGQGVLPSSVSPQAKEVGT